MGTPAAAVPSLRQCLAAGHDVVAVWTQPDRPSGRGNKVTPSPIKEFALANGIAVHQPTKIKTDEARALFASHQAEVVVVVAYGRILPQAFLQAPRRGCLNVHFSLLPLYRGAAPVNWAIVQGEKMTGVTTMFIEEKLDAGPILLQRETAIADHETAPELMARLAPMGGELLGETLARFDTLTPRPQHDRDASLAPLLKKEDGLIDWSGSAFVIDRCIRGFQPWPNAYTHYKSQRLIIWHAQPEALQDSPMTAGAIVAARGDEMIVSCGEHTQLRLLEVQPEARRRMSVRDFLNGLHVSVGDRLK